MSEEKFVFNFNAPVGQNIANVECMDVHMDKDAQIQVMNAEKLESGHPNQVAEKQHEERSEAPKNGLPHEGKVRIFKYVHPNIIEYEEQRIISQTVGNLVSRFDMRTICEQLKKMEKENKLLLPKMPDPILEELHHMGLPDESVSGYSKSNFVKYF